MMQLQLQKILDTIVRWFAFGNSYLILFIIVNETISARRLVHILVKLGKITKSTQQHRRPVSPSVLPEDREVTDIMTQNKASFFMVYN